MTFLLVSITDSASFSLPIIKVLFGTCSFQKEVALIGFREQTDGVYPSPIWQTDFFCCFPFNIQWSWVLSICPLLDFAFFCPDDNEENKLPSGHFLELRVAGRSFWVVLEIEANISRKSWKPSSPWQQLLRHLWSYLRLNVHMQTAPRKSTHWDPKAAFTLWWGSLPPFNRATTSMPTPSCSPLPVASWKPSPHTLLTHTLRSHYHPAWASGAVPVLQDV